MPRPDPDAIARQMGFRNAREFALWQAAQQRSQEAARQATPQQTPPSSVHEFLNMIMNLHPINALNHISDTLDNANKK